MSAGIPRTVPTSVTRVGDEFQLESDSLVVRLDASGLVPATLVAKLAAGSPQARQRVSEGYRKEVRFYSDLAGLVAVNTPTCWYAAISDNCQSFTLLLEDLAPAVPGQQKQGCRLDQAVAAVENLAGLHAPRSRPTKWR